VFSSGPFCVGLVNRCDDRGCSRPPRCVDQGYLFGVTASPDHPSNSWFDGGQHAAALSEEPWWIQPWRDAVLRPAEMVQLDVAATLVSAHGVRQEKGPALITETIAALDSIAEGCTFRTAYGEFEPVHHQVFHNYGFTGDSENYHDPRNSFLPHVLRTRRGIPISLTVVFMEVAKRCGVEVLGIGMPGHFLSAHTTMSGKTCWVDAFDHGAVLDLGGVAGIYHAMFGADRPFDPAVHLPAVDEHAICTRMLANLKSAAAHRRDVAALADIVWMRQYLPGPTLTERREHVRLCCAVGRFATAEAALESLARVLGPDDAIVAEERARHASLFN
jgi:hypothetical protein